MYTRFGSIAVQVNSLSDKIAPVVVVILLDLTRRGGFFNYPPNALYVYVTVSAPSLTVCTVRSTYKYTS